MKKFLFVVVGSLVFNTQVFALNKVTFSKDQAPICDEDNNTYQTYIMYYSGSILYFLNLSDNYNTNFEDYYEIPFEESPYSKDLSKYVINEIAGDEFLKRAIHILLWEELYPQKTFKSCRKVLVDDEGIDAMKKLYKEVNDFPLLGKNIYLEKDEIYEYYYEGLSYYELVDSSGLEVTLDDNVIKIKGNPGKYSVKLKRKYSKNVKESKLYTDGTNYLISSSSAPDDQYSFEVVIGYKDIILEVKDETNLVSGACFEINGEEYCSSQDGKIKLNLLENSLDVKLINLLENYEEYNETLIFDKDNVKKIFITSKKESIILNDEEQAEETLPPLKEPEVEIEYEEVIEIPLENTFVFPRWTIFLLVGLFAKKKIF